MEFSTMQISILGIGLLATLITCGCIYRLRSSLFKNPIPEDDLLSKILDNPLYHKKHNEIAERSIKANKVGLINLSKVLTHSKHLTNLIDWSCLSDQRKNILIENYGILKHELDNLR